MTATTRPPKQEQLPAADGITEVATGVLRLQLPIAMPGLGHVNCYILEDERGVTVVDPGLPGPSSWQELSKRLEGAGIPLRTVHTVVVTHSHPDHYGGARFLREETGADLLTHRSFRNWFNPLEPDLDDADDLMDPEPAPSDDPNVEALREALLRGRTPWGGPWVRMSDRADPEAVRYMGPPQPTIAVDEADVVRVGRRDWVAMHTPGHTPDHLCLYDPTNGVLLSGDHVLPTITPHIGGIGTGVDPLQRFLDSLARMHELEGVSTVLPAHGQPFTDLDGRVDAIRDHHLERLETLRKAGRDLDGGTVEDFSQRLFPERSWGPMAESETYAHLEHLHLAGHAERWEEDHFLRYRVG
jgi:glyoxylase-like metal-dependent hydrolase (beta-lactamase superfamily II)